MSSLSATIEEFGDLMQRLPLIEAPPDAFLVIYDLLAALGADLLAYWDATDYGTALVSDATTPARIQSWTDRIGGLTLTASGTARPTAAAGYCGGRQAFIFDGTANVMRMASTSGLPTGSTPGRIWVMAEAIGAPVSTLYYVSMGAASGAARRDVMRNSSERLRISDGATSINAIAVAGSTAGAQVSVGRWNGTTMTGRIRGADINPVGTIASLATGTTRFTVGANNSSTPIQFGHFAVTVLMVTTDSLTLDQTQQLESWGYREMRNLAALPADHPYKEGPDTSITFVTAPPRLVNVARPAMPPVLIDFREQLFGQIATSCASGGYAYNDAGVLVPVAADTPHWLDHDPVTLEPLGLKAFQSGTLWGSNRTAPAAQSIALSGPAVGYVVPYTVLAAYSFGSGSMRLTFTGGTAELLNDDGTTTGTFTDDVTWDSVDPNADGWYAGVHLFRLGQGVHVTCTLNFSGTVTFFQLQQSVPSPPHLSGPTNNEPIMTSPCAALALPSAATDLTIVHLAKSANMLSGGTWFQLDDDAATLSRITSNYIGDPNLANPSKAGQMGVTVAIGDSLAGVDPLDIIMAKQKWRCFAMSLSPTAGTVKVCCNGGAVHTASVDPDRFPVLLNTARWISQKSGASTSDGWLAGFYLAREYESSDSAIQDLCDPTGSVFGSFDPS